MSDAQRTWTPIFLGDTVAPPAGPYSPAVRAGDFVFVSGQVPRDPRSGEIVGESVEDQSRQTLMNVRGALEAAGARLEDVVSVTVYLANEEFWGTFNSVYVTMFSKPYPTRTVVGARLRGIQVEVSAIAYVGRRATP